MLLFSLLFWSVFTKRFFFFLWNATFRICHKRTKVKKKIIDYTIDCVDKNGALPEISELMQGLGISKDAALEFKAGDVYDNIRAIRSKYTYKRKDGFKSFVKFYAWYVAQHQKCHYCGTTQDELEQLFENGLISSKKFSGKLGLAFALGNHFELELGARSGFKFFDERDGNKGNGFRVFYVNGYGAITFLF